MNLEKQNKGLFIEVEDEVTLISALHDAAMTAPAERKLYYQLHKDITPLLLRVLQEAALNGGDVKSKMSAVLMIFTEYFASVLMTTSRYAGGPGDAQFEARKKIAFIMADQIKKHIEDRLDLLRDDDT